MATLELLNKGRSVQTFPNRPAGNVKPLNEVTIEKSMKYTGCFIVKGHQGFVDIYEAGFKGIAGLPPENHTPRGVLSDRAGGTLRGPPA
jgi:hypothetical protein